MVRPNVTHAGVRKLPTHIRETAINPNHWYVIARSTEVKNKPLSRTIWSEPVALFRGEDGQVHALEDRCPHRMVRVSYGQVVNGQLECPYHGWRFNAGGKCVHIPSLESRQKLPDCGMRSYPVFERHGFVWIFPGGRERSLERLPMGLPEWDDLGQIVSVAKIACRAHFSFLIENLMDMYHGHLHARYQTWTARSLQEVIREEERVVARYRADAYYKIDHGWSALQLFIPGLRHNYPVPLTVTYEYPHWKARLGDEFRLYCLFCPVSREFTEAYLIHFTSLHHYRFLSKAPEGVRRFVKRSLRNVAKRLLNGIVRQDVTMMEEEQGAFERDPARRPLELNRTLVAVQQLIQKQAAASAQSKPVGTQRSLANSRKQS